MQFGIWYLEFEISLLSYRIMKKLIHYLNQFKALRLAAYCSLCTLALSLLGLIVDDRILLGENVWLKPMKFGISITIFCITVAWLLAITPYSKNVKKRLDSILGWTLVIEFPLVLVQAFRGVRSHFNMDTVFDGIIFGSMGILIFINSLALLFLFGTAFVRKLDTYAAMQKAIQFSGIAMIVSMVAGQIMISNICLLYTSPSPRDATLSRMPSSA